MSSLDAYRILMMRITVIGCMALLCIGGSVMLAMSLIKGIPVGVLIGIIELSISALLWIPLIALAFKARKTRP